MEPISTTTLMIWGGSALVVGGASTLTGRIVWDWLKTRKNGSSNPCPPPPAPQLNGQLTGIWQSLNKNAEQTAQLTKVLEEHVRQGQAREERHYELFVKLNGVLENLQKNSGN